jgi:L-threonylcarbamoyladenylate synthase
VLGPDDAAAFERSISVGGVVVFPSDTVYGLACDPSNEDAVYRLYRLKGRRPERAAAVMFFSLELALAALPDLGPRTVAALHALLPGAVTLLVPNSAGRFGLACGDDPRTLGLRVPQLPAAAAALAAVSWPVLQSSANLTGGADAMRLVDVPEQVRAGADLLLDGGELPGVASTVIDLRSVEDEGRWDVGRAGAVPVDEVDRALRNI